MERLFLRPHGPHDCHHLSEHGTLHVYLARDDQVDFESLRVGGNAQRAFIYGTHAGAIAMTNEARNIKPMKFSIEGYIGDSKPHYDERLMGKRIYSTQEDIVKIIEDKGIKAILVSPLKHKMFVNNRKLQDALISAGVKIYIAQNAERWSKTRISTSMYSSAR